MVNQPYKHFKGKLFKKNRVHISFLDVETNSKALFFDI